MNKQLNGWFTELSPMWPGQAFSLKMKEMLFDKTSKYQHIQIFESSNHGRVLVLDGAIQCTERDECSYQEMITFLPLNSHPNPEKVLVVGGGDGGVLRELAKHPQVKEIHHCEIDKEVIDACKELIPSMGVGHTIPKVHLHTVDGASFLDETEDTFDVVITDATDPVVAGEDVDATKNGPSVTLFNNEYFGKIKKRLKENGILCCQGENMWLHGDLIADLIRGCREIYPVVEYAYTCTPTYPGGQIGFILCSLDKNSDFRNPVTQWTEEEAHSFSLKYYNEEIHRAAFILPTFMKRKLKLSH